DTNHSGIICELVAPACEAWPYGRIDSRCETGIERIDVILPSFNVEGVLKLFEFVRILLDQIVCLAEILVDVLQFPFEIIRIGLIAAGHPRQPERRRAGHPAILVDSSIANQLEILRAMAGWSVCVVEGVYEANPFEWFLLRTVHHRWRRNPDGFIDRWDNVDDMTKLRSDCTFVLNPRWPRDGQSIPGASEM